MAIATFWLRLCTASMFFGIIFARNLLVDRSSCAQRVPGVSWVDIDNAIDEAIEAAKNAATLLGNAAANPNTPESQRTILITEHMLACHPQDPTCGQARIYYDRVGQLKKSYDKGDDPLYFYCNEDDFRGAVKDGSGPNIVLPRGKYCSVNSKAEAMYIHPNVVLFCPTHWKSKIPETIMIGNHKTDNLNNKHIDTLTTTSMVILHEFLHASSRTSLKLFKDAIDVEILDLAMDFIGLPRKITGYEYENCRLIAAWAQLASNTNPIIGNNVYQNWEYMISHKSIDLIDDHRHAAGMAIFNADNMMFAAQMMFMINTNFADYGVGYDYASGGFKVKVPYTVTSSSSTSDETGVPKSPWDVDISDNVDANGVPISPWAKKRSLDDTAAENDLDVRDAFLQAHTWHAGIGIS